MGIISAKVEFAQEVGEMIEDGFPVRSSVASAEKLEQQTEFY